MNWPFHSGCQPSDWKRTKLRSFLTRRKRINRPDLPLLSVNLPKGVVLRQDGDGRVAPSRDLDGYQEVRPGDLVVNQLGKPHGALGVSDHHGIISPAYFVAEVSEEADPRFVHHLLRTRLYISEYERRGKYMPPSQFDISWEQFRDIPVTLPPLSEQRAIAAYLDIETARIDSLISKKRRLIELYANRIRYQAITLTTEHGHPIPLRRFISGIKTGTTPPERELPGLLGGDVAWFSPGDMGPYLDMRNPARTLSGRAIVDGWSPLFPADTTLIIGIGATAGRVGHSRYESTGNQQVTCISGNRRVVPRFLSWQLWARSDEIREVAPYTTLPILNNEFLRSLPFYAPSLETQQIIVETLDDIADSETQVSQLLQSQIELLNERRQSLITATVTGELSVPVVQK